MGTLKCLIAALAAASQALAGCIGPDSTMQHRRLEQGGFLSVAPGAVPNEYLVSIRSINDVGYDSDDKETRHQTALAYLRDQCPNGRQIIGETSIVTGPQGLLVSAPGRAYSIRVRCS